MVEIEGLYAPFLLCVLPLVTHYLFLPQLSIPILSHVQLVQQNDYLLLSFANV